MRTVPHMNIRPRSKGRRANFHYVAGLSLIELMIAVAIGLLLLAGVTALIAHQSTTSTELEKSSRQIENGRYAISVLQEAIQMAGYYGEYSDVATTPGTPASIPNPCSTALADLSAAMSVHIQGYDSPSTVPSPLSTCLPDANHVPGTDILVIRRADATTLAPASAVAGQIYLQSTQASYVVGSGSNTAVFTLKKKDGTTAADLRKYLVHIYFVSPCNIPNTTTCDSSADGGTPIPTLKRLELAVSGGNATFTTVSLAEGINNLQIDYGLDTDNDGAPDTYTTGTYSSGTTAMTAADWINVMTLRINVLSRNNESTGTYTDTNTYNMGAMGTVGPFNDHYKRHVFSQLVRVLNPSGRRER